MCSLNNFTTTGYLINYHHCLCNSLFLFEFFYNRQSNVFFYQDFSDSDPFILGIQTEWQLQQMIKFGNHGLLASDSRFGTNKLKYPVHSLLVFNSDKKAILVAWIITPKILLGS
ncbi:hypothetical protein MtrunA17_Chr7g0251461 [Medicago truncatula]|uniref:Zinc ion-binding protein n=1 Tax=Medicago truncatula TaxID=3880 RepID=G7KVA6_MEDTR|nr:zinc ion-binding protein [Medicago truncatula]RHN47300.1 hypothetical protein MtrunA17_Chr7g0251461 [Medicago truncatula]